MRDINLARRQFFAALLLFAGAFTLSSLILMPEVRQSKALNESSLHPEADRTSLFSSLPLITQHTNPPWQKTIAAKIHQQAELSNIQISAIQIALPTASFTKNLPSSIKQVGITVTAQGSYYALQAFAKAMESLFPLCLIQSVELRIKDVQMIEATASPLLEETIQLQLTAVSQQ